MADKYVYEEADLVELDLDTAPNLDLPAFQIEKFTMPKDGSPLMVFYLNVRNDWLPEDGCPVCHKTDMITLSGRSGPRCIRDIARNTYGVQIITQSPRMLCKRCNQRFTPKIDGIVQDGTMTERLVEYLKTASFTTPHATLEALTGVSIQTIQNIMDVEIERYEKIREENPLNAPRVLGIDEKHITNKMRGTVVDVENGLLLDMLEDNSKESFKEAITSLKDWDKNIKVVTTDMANSYLSWMPDFLPNATFVIDKFHVVQDVNQKVSKAKTQLIKYRKRLIDELPDGPEKNRQKEIYKIIYQNKRLFNYSTENLERNDGAKLKKLDTVIAEFPEFALLRKLYAYIELLYAQDTREEAERVWDEWQSELPPATNGKYRTWCKERDISPECFEAFQSLVRSGFTNFKPYILNYFKPGCKFTNATTEGLNNLIGRINSTGNGYRFKHLRAKALYMSLIYERKVYSINIKSIKSWKPTTYFTTIPSNLFREQPTEFEYKKKYVFNCQVEKCCFPPVNVLEENTEFFESLVSDKEYQRVPILRYTNDYSQATSLQELLDMTKEV